MASPGRWPARHRGELARLRELISLGGPGLVPKLGGRVPGAPVPLSDAAGAAARVVVGLDHWLVTLQMVVAGSTAVICSVLPEPFLCEEALLLFRRLSETLWQVRDM